MKVMRIEKWPPAKEALDCETNSPCQNLVKCLENSMENRQTDNRVERVIAGLTVLHCFRFGALFASL